MMGQHPPGQETLFYTNIILEERVRNNHPLRRINELIDFEFIYKEVKNKYGSKGNVSVPPPVILKLMLLKQIPASKLIQLSLTVNMEPKKIFLPAMIKVLMAICLY